MFWEHEYVMRKVQSEINPSCIIELQGLKINNYSASRQPNQNHFEKNGKNQLASDFSAREQ